jgi:ClpP class serine protease
MRNLIKAINGARPFLVDYQLALQHIELKKQAGITDIIRQMFGEAPKPYQVGSTRIIPIMGMIGANLSPLEAIGSADVAVIDDQIDEALADGVSRILFHINSDGGTIEGVEELAYKIQSLPVETVTYSSGSMNSAAYWIGASSSRVIVSGSASVGSVGVYAVVTDLSEQAKAMGIKVKVYRSDELKGMGVPGTEITPTQDAYLQKSVMDAADSFKASVMSKRKLVKYEDLTGASYTGKEASAKNLVTGIEPSLKALLMKLEGKVS